MRWRGGSVGSARQAYGPLSHPPWSVVIGRQQARMLVCCWIWYLRNPRLLPGCAGLNGIRATRNCINLPTVKHRHHIYTPRHSPALHILPCRRPTPQGLKLRTVAECVLSDVAPVSAFSCCSVACLQTRRTSPESACT